MKLTNTYDLPQPFVDAVSVDEYVRGDADITASECPRPVRINALTRHYWDKLQEDASERVWRLQGETKHIVFERLAKLNPERYEVEKRFTTALPGGKKVSGKLDLYDHETRTLQDWKESSVWKFMLGDTKEWEQQANVNLYCLRKNGIFPEKLQNIAILKDWKIRKARTSKDDNYPQCAIHLVDLPMWSVGQAEKYILSRIEANEQAREALNTGNDPLLCTKQERWQRDHVYAVKKKGTKRAIRLLDSMDQAYAMMNQLERQANPGERFEIEERPQEPVRCLDFCPVWQYCSYGKTAHEKWNIEND